MTTKIIHQDELYNMVEAFAERNGLDIEDFEVCGLDRAYKGSVYMKDGDFANRCEIESTKTEKVSNKYYGTGAFIWVCGDKESAVGKIMLALMAELNGEVVPAMASKFIAPEGIERTRDLKVIADILNTVEGMPKAGYFDKAAEPRVYLSMGHNTKKTRTKAYLTVSWDKVVAHVKVTSEDRHGFLMAASWTESQEQALLPAVEEIAEFVRAELLAPSGDAAAQVDQVLQDESLLDIIHGVVPQWREVRVAINSYGKLATRNRLFLTLWSGPKINAPRKLEEITPGMYAFAMANWKEGERMCEPGPAADSMRAALSTLATLANSTANN